MEERRAAAKRRLEETRRGMSFMFEDALATSPTHYELLRDRYLAQARQRIVAALPAGTAAPYEQLWDAAMSTPMVWDSDLRGWLADWRKAGAVELLGLKPRKRKLKLNEGHAIRCLRNLS